MRKFIAPIVLGALLLSGCANQDAYQNYLAAFEKASATNKEESAKPLVDITLPAPLAANGATQAPYHIVVNKEYKPMVVQQIKDSEWVSAVTGGIITAGLVAGKGFDYKIKQSDNDASVRMKESGDKAMTSQVQAYTDKFNKESTTTETLIESTIIP